MTQLISSLSASIGVARSRETLADEGLGFCLRLCPLSNRPPDDWVIHFRERQARGVHNVLDNRLPRYKEWMRIMGERGGWVLEISRFLDTS